MKNDCYEISPIFSKAINCVCANRPFLETHSFEILLGFALDQVIHDYLNNANSMPKPQLTII